MIWMKFNPSPHTTILQQTTLNLYLFNWIDNLWLKVKSIVAKREIACFEQFLLLSICFKLYSIIILRLIQIFHIFVQIFSMSSVVDMLYVGKGQWHMLEPMTRGLLSIGKYLLEITYPKQLDQFQPILTGMYLQCCWVYIQCKTVIAAASEKKKRAFLFF